MKLTQKDFKETTILAGIINNIDKIDGRYADATSDDIYKYQPFLLSVMLGYKFDVTLEELDEIIKIHFIIWEYFKTNPQIMKKQITETDFEKAQIKIIEMLKKIESEPRSTEK